MLRLQVVLRRHCFDAMMLLLLVSTKRRHFDTICCFLQVVLKASFRHYNNSFYKLVLKGVISTLCCFYKLGLKSFVNITTGSVDKTYRGDIRRYWDSCKDTWSGAPIPVAKTDHTAEQFGGRRVSAGKRGLESVTDTRNVAFRHPFSKLTKLVKSLNLNGHSLSPRICPPTLLASHERFGY